MISPIPRNMPVLIAIPARRKPVIRPIQNIGRCKTTPDATMAQPPQKASILLDEAKSDVFVSATSGMRLLGRYRAPILRTGRGALAAAEMVKGPGAQSKNSQQGIQDQG